MSEWEAGLKIYNRINVVIPERILNACDAIASAPKIGGNEFSIFLKIDRKEGNNIFLSEDFVVPPQKVTSTSINYGRDPEGAWQVVIHRHPAGMHTFSGTDMEYINQNFKISILYTPEAKFVKALVNVPYGEAGDEVLQIDGVPQVMRTPVDISMIEVGYQASSENYYSRNYGSTGNYGAGAKTAWPKDTPSAPKADAWDVDEGGKDENELLTFDEIEKKIDTIITPKLEELKETIKKKVADKEVKAK